jgi:DedD protein
MDLRAKQRLTGAIILVALFVLLVPELLTGPDDARPVGATAESEGLREYTIDIGDQNAVPATAQPSQPSAVNLPPVESPPASADAARAVPGEAAAPATPALATPAPVTPARVDPTPSAPPPVATNPMAAEPAPVPPSNQRPEPGTFVVQLGSFGSRDNADRLVRDMKAKGFSAFVAPITSNGRELYRVRVGPTRDRASAESLAAHLKRAGQSGSIVPIS